MYDELIKVLRFCETHATCRECVFCPKDDEDMRCNNLLMKAADAIEELQKRVPKSGVWREEESDYDDVYYECSVCGAGICTVDGDPVDNTWSYCPECGAKMAGVERLPEPPKEEIE